MNDLKQLQEDNKRCNGIELYKVVAAIFIAVYHYEWLYIKSPVYLQNFYLWVEFFFIISGFFIAKNASQSNKNAIEYAGKQICKLFPMYILGFFFTYFAKWVNCGWTVKEAIIILFQGKWELLMLQLSGVNTDVSLINAPTAQIPALLVASIVLWYLIQNHKKFFMNIGLIIAICIYAHILQTYGNLSQWTAFDGWMCVGVLRAFANMTIGALAYLILMNPALKINSKLRTLLIGSGWLFCGTLIWWREWLSFSDILFYVAIYVLIILFTFINENTVWKKLEKIRNNIILQLLNLSYPIFLVHTGVCLLLDKFVPGKTYGIMLIIYLVFVIVAGVLIKYITLIMGKVIKQCLLLLNKSYLKEEE